ncbi:MAG: phenylpyruvate tautomerase MIF-related protein [bacterium]|nr:phenylpyruvate tautomerase MIF-related protein [bacterium]
MPYIKTSTNVKIEEEKLNTIKSKMGQAIRLMGKTEDWLMLEFNDDVKMYFKGNSDNPIAFLDVRVLGGVNNSNEMTHELTNIISNELGISPNNIYITYQGYSDWGYNGSNF